jgi:hypothetical protein
MIHVLLFQGNFSNTHETFQDNLSNTHDTFFQENFVLDDDVLNLTSPDKYELVWYLPEDNGEPIDFFEISFYPVGFDPNSQTWNRKGDLFRCQFHQNFTSAFFV